MMKCTNVLIVGVGGQGIITASELLAEVAFTSGQDVKKSEVHGMAQRGGAVSSHVRFGKKVYSPLIPRGEADVLLAFEKAETLRWLGFVKQEGTVIVNDYKLVPPVTLTQNIEYPDNAIDLVKEQVTNVKIVPALQIAKELGSPRVVNILLLGVLSNLLSFTENEWKDSIQKRVPKGTEQLNIDAFIRGRNL